MNIRHLISRQARRPSEHTTSAPNVTYSQEAEDLVLSNLRGFAYSETGVYVDVGAHHPTRFSNTKLFYDRGWHGINIDPNPGVIEAFEKVRPRDVTLCVGVSDRRGEANFYTYNDSALNGIENDRSEELADTNFKLETVRKIKVRTLSSILEQHLPNGLSQPNFLTLDVEGHEFAVLKGNDWRKFRFQFLLVEHRLKTLLDLASDPTRDFLADLSYEPIACTGRTVIYRSTSA